MTGGAVVSEVGQLIALSNTQGGTPTPKVEPAPLLARDITWKLKDSWTVGETIDKASIGLGVSAGPDNAALTAPLPAKLAKGGVSVSVTAVAPAAEGYAEATLSKTVAVQKLKPLITWATPYPVEAGTKLSARELDADIAPPELRPRLVYAPKANDTLATVGVKTLKVSYAGDDGHEAASAQVSLKVVDGPEELAREVGVSGMLSGRAHRAPPEPTSKAALENWHKSDPDDPSSMKGQAKVIMTGIQGKTPKELLAYMDKLPGALRSEDKLNKKGNPKTYPAVIWILPNGLQVRYKPNGDGKNGLTEPMFCIEGRRTDIAGPTTEPDQTAFKVMPNGEAAPWGPRDTVLPDLGDDDLNRDAMDSACSTTHLYCAKMLDQVVTWASPGTLEVGTELTDKHLNATALDGAVPVYSLIGGGEIKAGTKLPKGTHTLRASTAETLRYKAAHADVSVRIELKPQVLAWTGPVTLKADQSLQAAWTTALGAPDLSYTIDGNAETGEAPLPRGKDLLMVVHAEETDEYAAADLEVTLSVDKSDWVIRWDDPPDIIAGTALTAEHLNAEAEGDGLFLEYEDEEGNKIKVGSTLDFIDRRYGDEDAEEEDVSEGQTQELRVTAKTSAAHNATTHSVQIKVMPRRREEPKGKQTATPKKGKETPAPTKDKGKSTPAPTKGKGGKQNQSKKRNH